MLQGVFYATLGPGGPLFLCALGILILLGSAILSLICTWTGYQHLAKRTGAFGMPVGFGVGIFGVIDYAYRLFL